MRFGIAASSSRFEVVRDTIEVQDPFGAGITLIIGRYGARQHQDFLRARQKANPLQRAIIQAAIESGITYGVGASGSAADEKAQREAAVRQRAADLLQAEIRSGAVDVFSLVDQFNENQRAEAWNLLRGWRNNRDEHGAEVAPTPEAIREFLSQDEVVIHEEGTYGFGLTLGEALCQFVLETAQKADGRRALVVGELEKNSETSVAGN